MNGTSERAVWPFFRPLLARHASWRGSLVPLVLLAILLVTGVLGYGGVARFCAERGRVAWNVATVVDAALPAVPWTIVVYLCFQVLFVVVAFAAPRGERGARELVLVFQALFAIGALSLAVFLCFPCCVDTRGAPELHQGSMAWLVALVESSDLPWNAWPSLHVSQSLVCTLALIRWHATRRPLVRVALVALWLAIAISTLTTKQHYLFDVLTGAWLGWAAWTWYLRRVFAG